MNFLVDAHLPRHLAFLLIEQVARMKRSVIREYVARMSRIP